METNDGMIILATTNHTENIDPAISDRPTDLIEFIFLYQPKNRGLKLSRIFLRHLRHHL